MSCWKLGRLQVCAALSWAVVPVVVGLLVEVVVLVVAVVVGAVVVVVGAVLVVVVLAPLLQGWLR
jgi:hypothetical protein